MNEACRFYRAQDVSVQTGPAPAGLFFLSHNLSGPSHASFNRLDTQLPISRNQKLAYPAVYVSGDFRDPDSPYPSLIGSGKINIDAQRH